MRSREAAEGRHFPEPGREVGLAFVRRSDRSELVGESANFRRFQAQGASESPIDRFPRRGAKLGPERSRQCGGRRFDRVAGIGFRHAPIIHRSPVGKTGNRDSTAKKKPGA